MVNILLLLALCSTDFERAPLKFDWKDMPPVTSETYRNGRVSVVKTGGFGVLRFERSGTWVTVSTISFDLQAFKTNVHVLGYNPIYDRYFEWKPNEEKPKEGSKVIMIKEHFNVPYAKNTPEGPIILGTIEVIITRFAVVHPDHDKLKTAHAVEKGPVTYRKDKPHLRPGK